MASKNFGLLNPLQCSDAIQNKQIVFNSEFSKITETNLRDENFKENSPQKIFGKFSRFKISILDGSSVSTNIKISQIAGIKARSDFAAKLHYEHEFSSNTAVDTFSTTSCAYTTKFIAGNFKGMSPAQVLLDNPDNGMSLLQEQYTFLQNNVDKYPNNKKIMDAVQEAGKLFKAGTLSAENNANSQTKQFDIVPETPKPNIHKTKMVNNVEMHPTHSLHIYCMVGEKYPIVIEIKNYDCPTKTTDTGGVNALVSKMDKDSFQHAEISLDIDTWLGIVSDLERQINIFAIMNGNEALKLAEKINFENSQNNK